MEQALTSSEQSLVTSDVREIQYEHSKNFVPLLAQLQVSLFVTTYQAGKLVVAGVHNNALQLSFHNFERAMGIAVGRNQIAIGGKDWVYFLKSAPDLATHMDPTGTRDACFLTRGAHYSGDISIHEIAWGAQELIITNTKFSCLCTLNNNFNFVPKWRPPFITALAPEDRCHLNGIAMARGTPQYATVLGQTDTVGGWRPNKATDGSILDLPSGKVVATGLAMPHSPRLMNGQLLVLNSGYGQVASVSIPSGTIESLVALPGYPRGMAIAGQFAFVGLSKVREKHTFGNLPISDRHDDLKCGVAIVDLQNARQIGFLEFQTGVDEIFDVQLLSGICNPFLSGPYASLDGNAPIWMVPQPNQ